MSIILSKKTILIEMIFCSETVDLIEDGAICCNSNSISYTVENEKIVILK